ncbi:MAG: hypothetical protein RL701_3613 [Pseudomonadota bacterium]|jgi:uncharacterized protein (TIRG00374 family)
MNQEVRANARAGLQEAADVPAKSSKRTLVVRSLVSLIITAGLVWLMGLSGIELIPKRENFATLELSSLVGFVALWLSCTFVRLYRWQHLLRSIDPKVPMLRTLGVSLVGFGALFAPMRMGEVARPLLISREKRITLIQGLGTVVAERIVDGVVLTTMLELGLWLTHPGFEPSASLAATNALVSGGMKRVPEVAAFFFALFICAFSAMLVFFFWRDFAQRTVKSLLGIVSPKLANFVTEQLLRLSESLSFLRSPKYALAFARDTLAYWFLSVASTMVLLHAAGAQLTFMQSAVAVGVLGLSTALPGPPGFFGTYQIGGLCGVALFFPELVPTAATVFVFVSYATQVFSAVAALALGMWILAVTRPPEAVGLQTPTPASAQSSS